MQRVLLRTRRLVLLVLIRRAVRFRHAHILSHAGKHGDGGRARVCRGRKKTVTPPADGSVYWPARSFVGTLGGNWGEFRLYNRGMVKLWLEC
jgi:hypothetical protein